MVICNIFWHTCDNWHARSSKAGVERQMQHNHSSARHCHRNGIVSRSVCRSCFWHRPEACCSAANFVGVSPIYCRAIPKRTIANCIVGKLVLHNMLCGSAADDAGTDSAHLRHADSAVHVRVHLAKRHRRLPRGLHNWQASPV